MKYGVEKSTWIKFGYSHKGFSEPIAAKLYVEYEHVLAMQTYGPPMSSCRVWGWDKKVARFLFTGSVPTGRHVAAMKVNLARRRRPSQGVGPQNLKRLTPHYCHTSH